MGNILPKSRRYVKTSVLPISGLSSASQDSEISFSFKHLATNHVKFTYTDRDSQYFIKLLERIKTICGMKGKDFKQVRQKPLRNHSISWGDTTESCFGIPNEEQLVECPWQFSVSSNAHGRVMGFFIQNTFHIVWLDPNHDLYE